MENATSSSVWPAEQSQYELTEIIGKGAFSTVHRAKCKSNSADVAIKIMDLENITTSFEDIVLEVQTMRLSDDDNLLRCYCSFVHLDQLWLVTQFMDKGSCLRVMTVAKSLGFGDGMNEEWIAYILKEALQGLKYLHDHGQIHRDIKSGNILVDSQGGVRLADFGVSGWMLQRGQRQESVKTFVGTPCWMAPEVMEQLEGYDYRADVWSIGITALELAKGSAPYAHYPPMRVLILTIEEDPPSLKSYANDRQRTGAPFSRSFEEFYKKCLQKNPKSRSTVDELLKHKFLKNRTRDALVHQLLEHIKPVGADELVADKGGTTVSNMSDNEMTAVAGSTPSDVITKRMAAVDISSQDSSPFVPGTTWVFDIPGDKATDKDSQSMDDFMDTFDSENATLKSSTIEPATSASSADTRPVMLRRQITDPIPLTPTSTSPNPRQQKDDSMDFLEEMEALTDGNA